MHLCANLEEPTNLKPFATFTFERRIENKTEEERQKYAYTSLMMHDKIISLLESYSF